MMEELISVIVPVYKVEVYLKRCVDSIINQSYQNLEIILVDDGSPDQCPQICDEYAKKDNRIKVIHKENEGLSSARNIGINVAKGEYIGFVDSDDWIALNMYEILYKVIKYFDADIACGEMVRVSDKEYKKNNYATDDYNFEIFDANEFAEKYFRITSQETVYYAWNKLYKRNVGKKIVYPQGLIAEDVEGFFYALVHSRRIVCINSVIYYYYFRRNSIASVWFTKKHMDIIKVWEHVLQLTHQYNKSEWIEYAELNYSRAFLGVLLRLMISGESNVYPSERQYLINEIKNHSYKLIKSNIPFSRKIIVVLLRINYRITELLLKLLKKINLVKDEMG